MTKYLSWRISFCAQVIIVIIIVICERFIVIRIDVVTTEIDRYKSGFLWFKELITYKIKDCPFVFSQSIYKIFPPKLIMLLLLYDNTRSKAKVINLMMVNKSLKIGCYLYLSYITRIIKAFYDVQIRQKMFQNLFIRAVNRKKIKMAWEEQLQHKFKDIFIPCCHFPLYQTMRNLSP